MGYRVQGFRVYGFQGLDPNHILDTESHSVWGFSSKLGRLQRPICTQSKILRGIYEGDYIGNAIGVIKGDIRSADYSSHPRCVGLSSRF